jgi:hypothetical protein
VTQVVYADILHSSLLPRLLPPVAIHGSHRMWRDLLAPRKRKHRFGVGATHLIDDRLLNAVMHKIGGWNSRLALAVCRMSVTGFWLKLTEYFGSGRTGERRHSPWSVF